MKRKGELYILQQGKLNYRGNLHRLSYELNIPQPPHIVPTWIEPSEQEDAAKLQLRSTMCNTITHFIHSVIS